MTIAVYAGSFDPITYGHLDILKKGTKLFDKVIIAVAYNPEKEGFLSVEDRVRLIKECTKDMSNVETACFDGLTVNFAKEHNASFLLRGIRNAQDFDYENQLAIINSKLDKNIETVFINASPEYDFISSSCVREIFSHKGDLTPFVPQAVSDFLYKG